MAFSTRSSRELERAAAGEEGNYAQSAVGQSEAFLGMQEAISRAARVERPVLLLGERGTGKELAAARLHFLSPRWGQPYVTLNCGALAPTLLESELFGHEAGAFTGAVGRRKGRFELAHGGTLFLDEVGNLPAPAQEKLLRVIEYGQFERVGGQQTLRVDVRLVAATNHDLRAAARSGAFRADLLDRLAFEVITLPPLRARGEDIVLLARHFARRMASELGLAEPPTFTPAAEAALRGHPWPGNVRELKNAVERMVYRAAGAAAGAAEPLSLDGRALDPFDSPWPLPPLPGGGGGSLAPLSAPPAVVVAGAYNGAAAPVEPAGGANLVLPAGEPSLPAAVRALELRALRAALVQTRWQQRPAAELLGLNYHQFRALYRKYKPARQEPPPGGG